MSGTKITKARNTAVQIIWTTLALVIGLAGCQSPSVSGPAATPGGVANGKTEPEFKEGYPTEQAVTQLKDQLLYQQAVQSYLWAMPVLNMYAMKEASERKFGKGYNVLPIFKERLNAKTLITTPNSDVIYALGFVFWRGFFQDPKQLEAPVKTMEQTRIYPLGKQASARAMQFPNASNVPLNMLMPRDSSAFDMLKRSIDNDYVDSADLDMRGMLAAIGIVKDKPFSPDTQTRDLLSRAARRATDMAHYVNYVLMPNYPGGKYYKDRQYVNGFPTVPGTPTFSTPTYTDMNLRSAFFVNAYSASPGMALNMPNMGAKYPATFKDADGNYLSGDHSYPMHLPFGIPAKLFWSVTLYDADNASGLNNRQPFPSINQMDKPAANSDGSIDVYFGPKSPGEGKNRIATVPRKGFFVILRLYGPTQPFFDRSWKPDDVVKTG